MGRLNLARNKIYLKLRDDADGASSGGGGGDGDAVLHEAAEDSNSDSDSGDDGGGAAASNTSLTKKNRKKSNDKGKTLQGKSKFTATVVAAAVEVEFDLSLSAYANARKMYAQRKVASVKEARTADASAKVLQQVGDKLQHSMETQNLKRSLRAVRKVSNITRYCDLMVIDLCFSNTLSCTPYISP